MKKISEEIKKGKILLCEGACGTELFKMGLTTTECPELWNISHPDKVLQLEKAYVEAGADIIETNSFGANPVKLKSFGLEDRAAEINRIAAEISRGAAGPDIYVAGCMGPSGKILMMGDVTEQELYESYSIQAQALEQGGADAAIIETVSDKDETMIMIRAVRNNTDLEIICSASYNKTPSGFKTMMGVSIEDMAGSSLSEGAKIIGTNCGYGIEMMIEIVCEIHQLFPSFPIIVQPNAGIPELTETGELIFPESPKFMASKIKNMVDAGANIIGGCCGTTPEYIRAFRHQLDELGFNR